MSKARKWCYTLNNWTDKEVKELQDITCDYHVIGNEVGDEGTPHLQGFIYFKTQKRLSTLKKLCPRAHWEAAKGTPFQAAEYCKKDEDFWEQGTAPMTQKEKGQSEQARYQQAWELAKQGKYEEVDADIRVRLYSTLRRIEKDHMAKVDDAADVTGVWIYGAAGVGKSRLAREKYPEHYTKMVNKWFDGYQGEETVIIDDVDPSHEYLGYYLKIWGDRYAFTAEIKGNALRIRPKRIIVTSQYKIEEIYKDEATQAALKRRYKVLHIISYDQSKNLFF